MIPLIQDGEKAISRSTEGQRLREYNSIVTLQGKRNKTFDI